MHFDDLALFLTVADAGGITAAAKRLSVPKSTISRGLSRLEEVLGLTLVQRTTRQVSLTAAGEALRARTAPHLASLRAALDDLPDGKKEPSGTLRITAPVDIGTTVLADIVAAFTRRYPLIDVDVRLSNAVVDLLTEGVDLALRISLKPLRSSSLVARRAVRIGTHLFASPQYLAERGVPNDFAALAGHDWIAYRNPEMRRIRSGGPERVRCDDVFFARAAAIAGLGVAVLPAFLAIDDVAAGRLVRVLPKWTSPSGTLWLVHTGGARPPAHVGAFRDFLHDALERSVVGNASTQKR